MRDGFTVTAPAVVGPISFMGLIVANLSRQLLRTYRHTQLVAGSVLGEAITGPMVLGIVFFLAGSLMGILPEFLRNRRKAAPLPQHEGE